VKIYFGSDRLFDAGISMSAGLFMVRSFMCYVSHPSASMLQECHLKGSGRLEAMITIAATEERRVPTRSGQLQ
jgi:hypothetical protein